MKKRSVGQSLYPARTIDAEGSVSHSQKKYNSMIGSIFQQFHSRGKVLKRAFSYPQNYLKYISLYSINSSNDAVPLDLSSRSSRPAPQTTLTKKTIKHSSENEITWKPVRRHSFQQKSVGKKWFPVNKKISSSENNKPTFFPLAKKGINNHHHFPWTNPLNHIFLQEKNTTEGNEAGTQEAQNNSKSLDQSSSHPKVGPLPAMKATVANPFKITPSSSWPLENNEQPSKPILAPPKFGANSVFGKYSSSRSAVAAEEKYLKNVRAAPTVAVSSSLEAPKPIFKLKPPVLGNALSSSPLPSKRPASKLDSTSSSSTSTGDTDGSDSKRARISTTEENTIVKETPIEINSNSQTNDADSATEKKDACSSLVLPSTPEKNVPSSTAQKDSPTPPIPTFVPLTNSPNKESPRPEENSSGVNGVGSTPPLSSKVGNAGFIFGQNLENRVSGVSPNSSTAFSNGETNPPSPTSENNLFTAAANSIATSSAAADGSKSLSESSREFSMKEESLKTKYEEVQVITGEEGEKNVIQMNCKLYGWSGGSWQERGRGILRLNDREIRDELHSRLVIRTQGTLTVMLNAKIWAEMSIEKSNDKSVRFTATDVDGQPKIYLVMGSPKDITLLHNSLEYRVAAARSQTLDEKERESDQDQDQDTVSQLSV